MATYDFTVSVSVERTEGKFASRDELIAQIVEALGDADPGTLEGENGGVYEVTEWAVEEDVPAPKKKKAKLDLDD